MQTQITVPLGGRAVTVHELTAGQIRAHLRGEELKAVAGHEPDPWDRVIEVGEGITLALLYALSDLRPGDIEQNTPTEMAALCAAVREANPYFFRVADRLRAVQDSFQKASPVAPTSASNSSATSTASSDSGTPTHGNTPTSPSNPPSLN